MDPLNIKFNDENIRKLFGSYDGEGEDIDRLSQYFLKTDTYDSVTSNIPAKILVGSKGVGKSALFRIAIKEGKESGKLCILIKPDDIAEIGEKHESLLISIRKWKYGLTQRIVKRILEEFDLYEEYSDRTNPIQFGGKIIPILNKAIKNIITDGQTPNDKIKLLTTISRDNPIEIYLDDLDRGWQNRKEGLIMISALINSIRDMSAENPSLIFKLALRTDVYNAVREADESSDKFEGLVTYCSYKLHDIYVLLIKRILTFAKEKFNESDLQTTNQNSTAHYLNAIFESNFSGKGGWANQPMHKVILSIIRNRPRDIVKLCTMAAKQANRNNSKIIRSMDLEAILEDYSKSLINDTIAEYKSELPSIDRLIYGMKPNRMEQKAADGYYYKSEELRSKLYKLSQQGNFRFANGSVDSPQNLISFLFKIGFLTATKRTEQGVIRKSYEDVSNLSSSYLDFGFDWEVHMGYRWAIQPESLEDIFARIKL